MAHPCFLLHKRICSRFAVCGWGHTQDVLHGTHGRPGGEHGRAIETQPSQAPKQWGHHSVPSPKNSHQHIFWKHKGMRRCALLIDAQAARWRNAHKCIDVKRYTETWPIVFLPWSRGVDCYDVALGLQETDLCGGGRTKRSAHSRSATLLSYTLKRGSCSATENPGLGDGRRHARNHVLQ